jgi:Asp-tRNA(Asn)/Glu-tRNA(Gln) amidotransferase C subunit
MKRISAVRFLEEVETFLTENDLDETTTVHELQTVLRDKIVDEARGRANRKAEPPEMIALDAQDE